MASAGDRDSIIDDRDGIIQHLMRDHRVLEKLLDRAEAGGEEDEMEALLQQLKLEIMLHTNVEDRVVYQHLERQPELAGEVEHARDEHSEVESILRSLEGLKPGAATMSARIRELREALLHHIEKEEESMLPRAADFLDGSTSRELSRRYEAEKEPERETLTTTEPGLEGVEPTVPMGD